MQTEKSIFWYEMWIDVRLLFGFSQTMLKCIWDILHYSNATFYKDFLVVNIIYLQNIILLFMQIGEGYIIWKNCALAVGTKCTIYK